MNLACCDERRMRLSVEMYKIFLKHFVSKVDTFISLSNIAGALIPNIFVSGCLECEPLHNAMIFLSSYRR